LLRAEAGAAENAALKTQQCAAWTESGKCETVEALRAEIAELKAAQWVKTDDELFGAAKFLENHPELDMLQSTAETSTGLKLTVIIVRGHTTPTALLKSYKEKFHRLRKALYDAAEKILHIRNRASKHLDGGDLPKKGVDELCREIEAFADELRTVAEGDK
jgi:hypothetical protein